MAVSDEIPGLEVTITVNGKPLKEYEDTTLREEERTVTRYIEAVSGQEFKVCFKVRNGAHFAGNLLACKISMDGNFVVTPILRKVSSRHGDHVRTIDGQEQAEGMMKKFFFSAIETAADGKKFQGEAQKIKELGSIVVAVTHENMAKVARKSKRSRSRPSLASRGPSDEVGILSEKATKGQTLSHSVGLSEAVRMTAGPSTSFNTKMVEGTLSPAANFVFHYRSYDALKSMLIIPRTPSPPPLEDQDVSTMTAAKFMQLQKELKEAKAAVEEAKAAAVKIKREHADDNPRPRKIARPRAGDTQLELDDDGGVREGSTATLPALEVIVLD